MSSFKVEVLRIQTVHHHPNADRLELVQVGDYHVVVGKDTLRVADLVAYIPEASIMPTDLIAEMGLTGRLAGKQCNRVKAIRLRGIVSQGLCYPARPGWAEGQLVTDELGIIKYIPPIPTCMGGQVFTAGLERTLRFDVENVKRYPDVIKNGELVVFTEKLHGCMDPATQVMLPNGEERPIGEIIADESITHVLSYEVDSGEFLPKKITGRSRRKASGAKWVRLTLENGRTLTCTKDHPLYSRDRETWVPAGEILPNEDIESPVS